MWLLSVEGDSCYLLKEILKEIADTSIEGDRSHI
jgi:hypothetical protein